MLRTGAELAAWLDLATLTDVSAKAGEILVVDVLNAVNAELADLSARGEASPATAWATSSRASATCSATATLWAPTFAALGLRSTEAGALGALASVFGSGFGSFLVVSHGLISP